MPATPIPHPPRADFAGAGVVEDVCIPGQPDPVAHRSHRSPRLAGHDHQPDRQAGQIELRFRRHFSQMERIARRHHEHRGGETAGHLQARQRRQPASRDRHRATGKDAVEATPEAEERAKRRGDENAVARADPTPREDRPPAFHPPSPIARGVKHRHRPAMRAARAMAADVRRERKGEIRRQAGRRGPGDELFFRRHRPGGKLGERLWQRPASPELRGIEGIGGEDLRQAGAELRELETVERGARSGREG